MLVLNHLSFIRIELKIFNIMPYYYRHPVYLYTVQFSENQQASRALQEMVNIASKHVTPNGGLQCKFSTALSTSELKGHFVKIAQSIREHQP